MSDKFYGTGTVALVEPGLAATAAPLSPVVSTGTVSRRRRRNQRGLTTVEYAVGTVAAASLGGVLIKIFTDPTIRETLLKLLLAVIEHFMKVF